MTSKNTLLVIDSEDKLSAVETTSRFTVRVKPAIVGARRVSLAFAILPNTTYNVNSSNNVLSWSDGTGTHTVSVTPGSYNTTNLGTTIASTMTATGSQTYTVAYNSITYHYTISAVGAFTLLYTSATVGTIYPTLGYKFSSNPSPATSFESNAAIALWDAPYYVVRVDKIISHVQTTNGASNIGTFLINNSTAQNGDIRHWTQFNNFNEVSGINVNIDSLFIELYDHRGQLADINDSDWAMGLSIDYGDDDLPQVMLLGGGC
jgi:hypothetical protein